MRLRLAASFLVLLLAATAFTPALPAGEWLEIARDGRTMRTWVARPAGDGLHPTIIVIHANRGLDDWTRSVADRLAAEGYIAAAPDLLSGTAPDGGGTADFASSDAARDGIYALSDDEVRSDLFALADWLHTADGSNGKVSVSGFCWGGSRTFWMATQRPGLAAAYVFYGTAPEGEDALATVDAPVYGFYGGDDARVNATIEPTAALLRANGDTYEPMVYDGAGHGFMARGEAEDASEANRAAMQQSWERWRELLKRH